jgi:hypothetical protein
LEPSSMVFCFFGGALHANAKASAQASGEERMTRW